MQTYADSSFLVSLFGEDARSEHAKRYIIRHPQSLPYTPWHRLEVRNALRLAVMRGEMDQPGCKAAFSQVDADLREGFLVHTAISWTDVLRRAEALSERHTETLGNRAFDILHVAIALEGSAQNFLSFDKQQRRLAEAQKLRVSP